MKFVRFEKEGFLSYGILENGLVRPVKGSIFEDYQELTWEYKVDDLILLAPCLPSKILCVGLNYKDHAEEMGLPIPKLPIIFMKPSTTVIGPNEDIVYPSHFCNRLDYEAELAIVIKKVAKDVEEEKTTDYILGYTCANDVTARDLQPKDGQWTIAKSFDTFLPLGPVIAGDIEPDNLNITCRLNGEIKQLSNTKNFIFSIPFLVSYLSCIMTLLPGDVIITGTPSGVSAMNHGDEVSVSIEGVGSLINRVNKI